jgi:hypothetical protein
VNGVLITIDDITNAISTIEIVLLILRLMRWTCTGRRLRIVHLIAMLVAIRWTIGASIDMTEACIAQTAVFCELCFA